MLVRTDLFAELEGFDPATFPGAEDLDLCWRARLAGARVLVVPDARATHRAGRDRPPARRPPRRVRDGAVACPRAVHVVLVAQAAVAGARRLRGGVRRSDRRPADRSPAAGPGRDRQLVLEPAPRAPTPRVAASGPRRCARCTTPSCASCRCRAPRASARSSPTTSTPTPACAPSATRRAARSTRCPTACARRRRSPSSASS